MWIYPETMQVFTHHHEIRAAFYNVSLPEDLTNDVLASIGVLPVLDGPVPAFDSRTEKLIAAYELLDGAWVCTWSVAQMTQAESEQFMAAEVAAYETALTDHLDAVAQSRRYDNRITCALRAGYVGPYHDECAAFALWMDTCNATAYQWMQEIAAGTRPMFNSPEEMISQLPLMVWPQ